LGSFVDPCPSIVVRDDLVKRSDSLVERRRGGGVTTLPSLPLPCSSVIKGPTHLIPI
jgi:hypothetical protein